MSDLFLRSARRSTPISLLLVLLISNSLPFFSQENLVLMDSDDEAESRWSEERPKTFERHHSLLITMAVDDADGPVEVKNLIFKHGTRGSKYGPAWYECLVRGPTDTVTIKESTDRDSFMHWLEQQTQGYLTHQTPPPPQGPP